MLLEPISIETILTRLETQQIGRNIVYRSSVSSTMDVALEEIKKGATHGTVILADVQEHGKGRLEREWISPQGGVYLSIILYPPREMISSLTMIAGLAVLDCVKDVCGIKADVKWPNDILINGKKVSGILAQSGNASSGGCYAILGIGINADMDVTQQPEIAGIATSLSIVAGKPVNRQLVICSLLQNFEKRYLAFGSGQALWKEWRERLSTLGKRVLVKSGQSTFEGIAESVSSDGSLLLRQDGGELAVIPAGDVTLRI
jgi:BirA family biotin operon repressor/biotin-[acetyl-CoA-carboxylase] ligase